MYTTDEWGNTVFHITTGKAGYEMLEKMGMKNMPSEEYEKHMNSANKLREKHWNEFVEMMNKIMK